MPKEKTTIEKEISENLTAAFGLADESARSLQRLLGLPKSALPEIRGTMVDLAFAAGDARMQTMRRHFPDIDAIYSAALADAKQSSNKPPLSPS